MPHAKSVEVLAFLNGKEIGHTKDTLRMQWGKLCIYAVMKLAGFSTLRRGALQHYGMRARTKTSADRLKRNSLIKVSLAK